MYLCAARYPEVMAVVLAGLIMSSKIELAINVRVSRTSALIYNYQTSC